MTHEIFLVGGAVRDAALGLPVHDRDWVVVGSTPAQMKAAGFRAVGKDFPVFLHPQTQEEYALARTERKVGHGYHGFTFNAAPDVTLEQDLARRDLTINALAQRADGTVVDPYGGLEDLRNRVLRHVSDAFVEDPLRVLRVARFAARFHRLGFTVAPETLALMRSLSCPEELLALSAERLWQETRSALGEADPQVFFEVLEQCGALAVVFPELACLRGVPQPAQHHPEIDTLTHQYLALKAAVALDAPLEARFAVLVHDLGKGATREADWPRHIAHERRGVARVKALCERLKVPSALRELGMLTAEWHTHSHRALELRLDTLWKLLRAFDVLRRPERFEQFLLACEADARGREGFAERPYPQADYLRGAARAARDVDLDALTHSGLEGRALGAAIEQARLDALAQYKHPSSPAP